MQRTEFLALLVALSAQFVTACAPVAVQNRAVETPVDERTTREGRPKSREFSATTKPEDDGIAIALVAHENCVEHREHVVHRRLLVHRQANTTALWLSYGLGAAGLVGGALYMALGTSSVDPMTQMPVDPTMGYALGGAFLGLGVAGIGVGIGTSIRARDSEQDLGNVVVSDPAEDTVVSCGRRAAPHQQVRLTADITVGTESHAVSIDLEATDENGNTQVRWERLAPFFDSGWPPERATMRLRSGEDLGPVSVDGARWFWARHWQAEAAVLAHEDRVDDATSAADRADRLGADTQEVRTKIAAAPTSVQRRANKEAAEQQARAQRYGLLVSLLPVTVGEAWDEATDKLTQAARRTETKRIPGLDVLIGWLPFDLGFTKLTGVALETYDNVHVNAIRLDPEWRGEHACRRFVAELKRSLGTGWLVQKPERGSQYEAELPGELHVRAYCNRYMNARVELLEPWLSLPTGLSGIGVQTVGDATGRVIENWIAACVATRTPAWETLSSWREAYTTLAKGLANAAGAVDGLSQRSRSTFADFNRSVLSEQRFKAQYRRAFDEIVPH